MKSTRLLSIILCFSLLLSSVAMLVSCEYEEDWDGRSKKKSTESESDTESREQPKAPWWDNIITIPPIYETERETDICTEPYWHESETLIDIETESKPIYEENESFEKAHMDFAVELFKETIDKREDDSSALISPLSVMLALAMTANGADGRTLADMEKVLGGLSIDELNESLSNYVASLPDHAKYKLMIANSIWMKDDGDLQINEEFLNQVWAYYNAAPYTEPFDEATVQKINEWVEKSTSGMIKNMLSEIPKEAVLYLINAICFDAQWATTYEDYQVKEGYFTDVHGNVKKVEMLSSTEGKYLEDENAIGFMKPYAGGYSFVALLPKNGKSVYDYISSLNGDSLMSMLRNPQYPEVCAKLPAFSYDFDLELGDVLKNMGMESAFVGNAPDFTRMGAHTSGPLGISRVLHKTHIEVTQYGTRAGASTVVEVYPESEPMPSNTKNVVLDRPFVYMIVENKTKLPVFIGSVTEMADKETVGIREYIVPTSKEYIRIDGCGDLEGMLSPVMDEGGYIRIDSTAELDELSNLLKSHNLYFMLDSHDGSFIDMYARINSSFFEENSLIFVYVTEGSGSISHRIDACYIDQSMDPSPLVMEICNLTPFMGTDDMAGWLIGVGIPKNTDGFGYVKVAESIELVGEMYYY